MDGYTRRGILFGSVAVALGNTAVMLSRWTRNKVFGASKPAPGPRVSGSHTGAVVLPKKMPYQFGVPWLSEEEWNGASEEEQAQLLNDMTINVIAASNRQKLDLSERVELALQAQAWLAAGFHDVMARNRERYPDAVLLHQDLCVRTFPGIMMKTGQVVPKSTTLACDRLFPVGIRWECWVYQLDGREVGTQFIATIVSWVSARHDSFYLPWRSQRETLNQRLHELFPDPAVCEKAQRWARSVPEPISWCGCLE